MSEIYILDELPILDSPPSAQQEVQVRLPTLKPHLYSRDNGVTIYGDSSPPGWTVVTHAYKGQSAYEHWMRSLPLGLFPRAVCLVLLKWLRTKQIDVPGWRGQAVIVSGQAMTEIHFLTYAEEFDVSLDLHVSSCERTCAALQRGSDLLSEVVL